MEKRHQIPTKKTFNHQQHKQNTAYIIVLTNGGDTYQYKVCEN